MVNDHALAKQENFAGGGGDGGVGIPTGFILRPQSIPVPEVALGSHLLAKSNSGAAEAPQRQRYKV